PVQRGRKRQGSSISSAPRGVTFFPAANEGPWYSKSGLSAGSSWTEVMETESSPTLRFPAGPWPAVGPVGIACAEGQEGSRRDGHQPRVQPSKPSGQRVSPCGKLGWRPHGSRFPPSRNHASRATSRRSSSSPATSSLDILREEGTRHPSPRATGGVSGLGADERAVPGHAVAEVEVAVGTGGQGRGRDFAWRERGNRDPAAREQHPRGVVRRLAVDPTPADEDPARGAAAAPLAHGYQRAVLLPEHARLGGEPERAVLVDLHLQDGGPGIESQVPGALVRREREDPVLRRDEDATVLVDQKPADRDLGPEPLPFRGTRAQADEAMRGDRHHGRAVVEPSHVDEVDGGGRIARIPCRESVE